MAIELLYAAQKLFLSSLHFSHGGAVSAEVQDLTLQRQMSLQRGAKTKKINIVKIKLLYKNY